MEVFCTRSFSARKVLLLSEELSGKLTGNDIPSKFSRLQPKYKGNHIKVNIESSGYGDVEYVISAKPTSATAHREYFFTLCLDRRGFQAILLTILYEDQFMKVVVKGNRPLCPDCKKRGHFRRPCTPKTPKTTWIKIMTAAAVATATTVASKQSTKARIRKLGTTQTKREVTQVTLKEKINSPEKSTIATITTLKPQ